MSKARLVITAVVREHVSQAEAARRYGVSPGWVSKLVALWRHEGEAAYQPRSRRRHSTRGIGRRCPWKTVEQVEVASLEYVSWWNNQRLHSELDYRTPAEVEAAYYAHLEPPEPAEASFGNR